MATKLHLTNGLFLYYENGKAVTHYDYPVKRWSGSNTNWCISTGAEVKDFKGKTILDLEKILWYIYWKSEKSLSIITRTFIYNVFLFYIIKYDKI